ncbi:antibiotic biosynthesis monooxygenase [Sulfitobacter sp. BDSS02]|uniref:putative quinol monooxygenase n=1 Tax=Heliomarina baculiformis TaxID=2872036 RepID=UPI001EE32B16|nr:putative quinol monooxygenase [Heliomarina baculiformis]MBL3704579.1 antibiotic biosynthesis monooxygenase [Sulfitobacter sp. BDSS02]MBR9850906.1 antibiotic biosynthesis monooxygenase [Paracoccaceae bacterium]
MLIVSGTMKVEESGIDAMKTAAETMSRETRKERGCITYAFWQNVEDPSEFRVYEEWQDMDYLKSHAESDHMATYREKLKEIGVIARDINLFEPGPFTKL